MLGKYELEQHELALLGEMVRTVDLLDQLAAIVAREGLMVEGPHGSPSRIRGWLRRGKRGSRWPGSQRRCVCRPATRTIRLRVGVRSAVLGCVVFTHSRRACVMRRRPEHARVRVVAERAARMSLRPSIWRRCASGMRGGPVGWLVLEA